MCPETPDGRFETTRFWHGGYVRWSEDGLINLDDLADAYWYLYTQPRAAWTHELDLRTFKEPF